MEGGGCHTFGPPTVTLFERRGHGTYAGGVAVWSKGGDGLQIFFGALSGGAIGVLGGLAAGPYAAWYTVVGIGALSSGLSEFSVQAILHKGIDFTQILKQAVIGGALAFAGKLAGDLIRRTPGSNPGIFGSKGAKVAMESGGMSTYVATGQAAGDYIEGQLNPPATFDPNLYKGCPDFALSYFQSHPVAQFIYIVNPNGGIGFRIPNPLLNNYQGF